VGGRTGCCHQVIDHPEGFLVSGGEATMNRLLGSVLTAALVSGLAGPVRGADDKEVQAVLDKAIKALGGAEKLGAVKAFTWKAKDKISFGERSSGTRAAADFYRPVGLIEAGGQGPSCHQGILTGVALVKVA
jgi:hypothetical protein